MVYYHTNQPVWNELVKVNVGYAEYSRTHLKFYFSHCSSSSEKCVAGRITLPDPNTLSPLPTPRPKERFAFAFLPLEEVPEDSKERTKVALPDKERKLDVYKYDPRFDSGRGQGRPPYLNPNTQPERSGNDRFTVASLLCSTKWGGPGGAGVSAILPLIPLLRQTDAKDVAAEFAEVEVDARARRQAQHQGDAQAGDGRGRRGRAQVPDRHLRCAVWYSRRICRLGGCEALRESVAALATRAPSPRTCSTRWCF